MLYVRLSSLPLRGLLSLESLAYEPFMALCTAVPISAGLSATTMPAASRAAISRGRALAAGNDRAGVTHPFARRGGSAGNKGGDGLVHVLST